MSKIMVINFMLLMHMHYGWFYVLLLYFMF